MFPMMWHLIEAVLRQGAGAAWGELVPEAGLEPARPLRAQVFETCASADSATPAGRTQPRVVTHHGQQRVLPHSFPLRRSR